jgi:Protein of unknown function C-terminus (DUF2399)
MLIVTAKGFPDEATVELLRTIIATTDCRLFYLGDLDPFGLTIFFNYRKRLLIDQQNRPLIWLGLSASDLVRIATAVCSIAQLGIPVKIVVIGFVYFSSPTEIRRCLSL